MSIVRRSAVVAAALALALMIPAALAGSIATTKHNLSVSGPGIVKASAEQRICVFCHAPHRTSPLAPLWNRQSQGSTYTPYSSSTAHANPGQPTGSSLLCLSCHDGTTALGNVLSRDTNIVMRLGVSVMPNVPGLIGTDLSDDHPVSFPYTSALAAANPELVDPILLPGETRLDDNSLMQCGTCHDAHDDTHGYFLVMANTASALCVTCHDLAGWNASSHGTSPATWSGVGTDPWPKSSESSVAANACGNCHASHSAGSHGQLLAHASEEANCTACHNGNVATPDIDAQFRKVSTHPLANTTGVHDAAETTLVTDRHVECVDCHDAHATTGSNGTLPGSLTGVRGIDKTGTDVAGITFEYELCARCHGDSPGQPAPVTNRQVPGGSIMDRFNESNPSHHAVLGPGNNSMVPSLISPLTTGSVIKCGDCHGNDDVTGPAGPHGSNFPSILSGRYSKIDNLEETPPLYALCYSCHSRTSLMGAPVKLHKVHLLDAKTPCNTCHEPHGVDGGNSVNNSKLVNFDTDIVTPNVNGDLMFMSTGPYTGTCLLSCHGREHDNTIDFSYP